MKCISFDVFGTCLVRRAGAPTEIFRRVGHGIAARTGAPNAEAFAEDFVEWRCEAERRALARTAREDVRLGEIWSELLRMTGPGALGGGDGPALEMAAEAEALAPIGSTRDRIARERSLGRRIIFISDNCLPAAFISERLRSGGLAEAGEALYVSGEEGLTKRTGSLFRRVLEAEKLDPSDLTHIGDDPVADVEAPRRLGIAVERFGESLPAPAEQMLLHRRPSESGRWVETAGALAFGRLAGPSRAADVSDGEALVDEFLGPFLCVFGHWVLRRAARDGRRRLFFASRDARLLWTACRGLSRPDPEPWDLRYLRVSRQAVLLPAATAVSAEAMPWLRRDFETPTLPRLLAKLELGYEECAKQWVAGRPGWRIGDSLETPADWSAFWELLRDPAIEPRILGTIERRRANARSYLASAGALDPVPAGFVDLGWFLTCQAGLNRLCAGPANGFPLKGYYLALSRRRLGPAEAGEATALFRQNPADLPVPGQLGWLWRNHLLEHIAGLADHPSVYAYGPNGAVEYAPSSRGLDPESFRRIEQAVAAYAEASGPAWKDLASDDRQAAGFLGELLNGFFERPSEPCVRALGEIRFSSDQGRRNSERLVEPYSWPDVLSSWLPGPLTGGAGSSRYRRWWAEASAVATPRPRRALQRGSRLARRAYHLFGWE